MAVLSSGPEGDDTKRRRERNRGTLTRWLSTTPWDRDLFPMIAEDGRLEFRFTPPDHPKNGELLKVTTPTLEDVLTGTSADTTEGTIFDTTDPTKFIAHREYASYGTKFGDLESSFDSEFVILYIVDEGKVHLVSEYLNPLEMLKSAGVRVPGVVLNCDEDVR